MEDSPYVTLEITPNNGDIWEAYQDQVKSSPVDILMPNGLYISLNVKKHASLQEIKDEAWEVAQTMPLFGLLRDSDSYVFQCVNASTAERDEIADEQRTLAEVSPFHALLRLVEKKGDKEQKRLNTRLRFVVGQGHREFDDQKDPEVHDFRKRMKLYCDSVCADLSRETWERRVLREYPVSLEINPEIAEQVNGNIVLTISVEHQESESTFKLSVPLHLNAQQLLDLVLLKKGPSIGLQQVVNQNYLLKICGLEEFLIGSHPISKYKYIRDCMICNKSPELLIVSADSIQLENCWRNCTSEKYVDRQRSRSVSSDSGTLKRKKKNNTLSKLSLDQPLVLNVHSVHKFSYECKGKVAVQCGIYHGDEMLSKVFHTTEIPISEEGQGSWEEPISLDITVSNLPRMAKLCLCVYEVGASQKSSKFRKFQDKYVCPLAWVNMMVFDYKGNLRSVPTTLSTWSYKAEDFSEVMLRPLGWVVGNPCKDLCAASLTVSFKKYHSTLPYAYPPLDEIVEHAKEIEKDCMDPITSCGVQPGRRPHKFQLQHLREICEKDTLYQIHEQDKQLMWLLRQDCCELLPNSLPKLLKCVRWNDCREIAEITSLLQLWPPMVPHKALELLDYAYPDSTVRSFAVSCLQNISDDELSMYLLQLVQALKHEPYLQNDLTKFLLKRALENKHIGHRLFWLMRSEIHFPEASIRFGLILEAYCKSVPAHLEALEKQVEALEKLKSANVYIKDKLVNRKELRCMFQNMFEKSRYQAIFRGLLNPLDPRFKFGKIRLEKCKCLDSKMKPLWLAFENTDSYGKDVFLIFKNGDDLRQDMLTLQMIRIMDRMWKDEGLDLRMIPYQCLATGNKVGLIEVVPHADTIANIQKEKGLVATSAFQKGSILSWLKDHNPDELSLAKAAEEFTLSCAGYCVATYVLGVADRHSDNIMVKTNGQLFHVDFGHILGKFKEKFGFKRERVPFVLTHDFVYIITKGHTQRSQEFSRFQGYCERAFMILRRRGPLVISLFAMMLSTGIPELSSEKDLNYLRETLVLDMTEQEALKHFRSKFDEALKNSWKTSMNWMAHNWAKDNKMSDG